MIKGITIVRPAGTPEAYDRLASFFSALGFEGGRGWDQETSRGVSFLAPLGNLEFADGMAPLPSQIMVEVTALDAVHAVAHDWMMRNWGEQETEHRLSSVEDTAWKSRQFIVEPAPGHSIVFWELDDPHKGRPIAVEGDLSAHGMRFAIVVSRWNAVITDRLLQGALDGLYRSGAARRDVQVFRVPGAWEIPLAARKAASQGQVDAVITLGVLLRGETAHYEAIYNEVSRGIGQSQQETGIPHAFGVLTCETLEQALNRAGIKAGNKGFEAAIAAIEMVSLDRKMAAQVSSQNTVPTP
ncbi:MAG TPA: 6,7-dimethyl-8-ribityllumazine synthase [Acidobacteriaceae bacterium]|nr:6,7-dimethyl-8-ribityllumazine synthase [Acidobacteriaceae bacterium]